MLSVKTYNEIVQELRLQADGLAELAKALGITGNAKLRSDLYERSFTLRALAKQLDAAVSTDLNAVVKAAEASSAAILEAAIGR
jgi:hypothetical protein